MSKVIKLSNGLEVEVELSDNQAHKISDKGVVDASIDNIQEMLTKVMTPIRIHTKSLIKTCKLILPRWQWE